MITTKDINRYVHNRLESYGCRPDKIEQLASTFTTPALEAVAGDDMITILAGTVSSGKTLAATAWLRDRVLADAIEQNRPSNDPIENALQEIGLYYQHPPLFASAAELCRFDRFSQEDMDRLLRAAYLVVDDLGAEYADKNGFLLGLLDELFDVRYSRKLPVVFTTNMDVGKFKERYGSRICERVREVGRWIDVSIPSLRKKVA